MTTEPENVKLFDLRFEEEAQGNGPHETRLILSHRPARQVADYLMNLCYTHAYQYIVQPANADEAEVEDYLRGDEWLTEYREDSEGDYEAEVKALAEQLVKAIDQLTRAAIVDSLFTHSLNVTACAKVHGKLEATVIGDVFLEAKRRLYV